MSTRRVVIPALVAALPLPRRPARYAALARRLLRRRAGAARGRVLDADPPPRPALPADRAPAAERDPRRVGAAPRGARNLAGDGSGGSAIQARWRIADRTPPSRCPSGSPTTSPGTCRRLRLRARPPVVADPHRARVLLRRPACSSGGRSSTTSPRRLASGVRAGYAFASFVLASPIGLLLALLPRPIYDFYVDAPRASGAHRRSPTRRSQA